jgi:predicted ATPase/DNA-binding SARP family transcriptional activator
MTASGTRHLWLLGPARVEQIHTARSETQKQGADAPPRFRSRRTMSLLGYLVAERRPVAREFLAGLFWPDEVYARGRANLSRELHNLAQILPGCWELDRQAVAFVPSANTTVDLYQLPVLEAQERWAEAAELLGGEFLEGVTLDDNPEFENWLLGERERWRACAETVLTRVIEGHTRRGRYTDGLHNAQRLLQLAPWNEQAHRQVMRLLAWTGQRGAALRQFESCKRALSEELDVEPAVETVALYQQIQAGKLDLPPQLPAFLTEEKARHAFERPPFVARERELARLDVFLETALTGQGQVIFVTGGPGRGKTALLDAFARRAMTAHRDLLVAMGSCNAYSGLGDPYLPFRDVMGMLTGDVEARWDAGAITRDHARRLWAAFPLVVQALLDHDPHLVGVFIPRAAFLSRATAAGYDSAPWLPRLREHIKHSRTGSQDVEQSHLFEQITDVLRTITREQPLLLILDDLQWADAASIGLLFHLGRRLADADSRILIACAYRPEEVAIGRAGPSILRQAQGEAGSGQARRHLLAKPLSEFKRAFGNVWVDVAPAEAAQGRRFVDALLDAEPNRLAEGFHDRLFRRTEGHPLFTVELLRAMQERGDLLKDENGRWIEGSALDWELLPARVEAVIEERIDRLDPELQEILTVASVEGETFTAQVVAEMLAMDERTALRRLSGDLARRHRLAREQEEVQTGRGRLSRYRFGHVLFQDYVYKRLSPGERRLLHGEVAAALEGLYGDEIAEIAAQLAYHYTEAGQAEKAIYYLHQAGERAVQLSAYQEGIAHLTRGLALIEALPDFGREEKRLEHAQQELALQLALGIAWRGTKGYGPEAERAYTRARELCQQTGNTSQLCQVLGKLSILHFVSAEHQKAREFAEEALSLAQQAEDPLHIALGHWYLGSVLLFLGEYTAARAHLEQMIAFYEPQQHRSLVLLRGSDAGLCALANDACCLWCLGYPEQALKRSQEVLALARELGHPISLANVLYFAGCLFNKMRRDAQAFKDTAEELTRLSNEKGLSWSRGAASRRGEVLVIEGQVQEGIVPLREGIAVCRSFGSLRHLPGRLFSLAEAQAKAGHPGEGLITLAEALVLVEDTDERHWEAELYRLQAELLLAQGDEAEAEASLLKAIEVARRQSAKSWELRATVSLCRLWQKQGRVDEARQMLAEIYGWFTEGFDTPDLRNAKALLDALA